jgi:hypothetical protein
MRASIEDEIAGLDKLAVEAIHGGAPVAVAVIDAQRPNDPANGSPEVAHST